MNLDYWSEVKWSESRSVLSDSLRPHGLYSPWNSPSWNTGVGSLSLLQGIIPTEGSNPSLPHFRQILYKLSHKGSPRILEWIAYPFSRISSWPRNWTGVSCIAGEFFSNWAIREAPPTCILIHWTNTLCESEPKIQRLLALDFKLRHSLAMWPWARFLTSLCLSFHSTIWAANSPYPLG